jgi:hypothetical protein
VANETPRHGNNLPVPDPTILTTQALEREVENLREMVEREVAGLKELVFDRLKGQGLLCDEKFRAIGDQFTFVESLRLEQKKDTKDAVDAALTAQKEAVSKSETGMTGRLEQLSVTFTTTVESLRREMGDMKDRIIEVDRKAEASAQQKIGAKEDRTGLYAGIATIVVILSVVFAVIAILIGN